MNPDIFILDEQAALPPQPVEPKTTHYIQMPWHWMRAANLAGSAALAVAALLWYRYKITGNEVVVLSNVLAHQAGLTRKAKYRGLEALLKNGLIRKLESKRGQAPRVVLLQHKDWEQKERASPQAYGSCDNIAKGVA